MNNIDPVHPDLKRKNIGEIVNVLMLLQDNARQNQDAILQQHAQDLIEFMQREGLEFGKRKTKKKSKKSKKKSKKLRKFRQ
jgi:hypothetical protein